MVSILTPQSKLCNALDPRLPGKTICLRPSQMKFPAARTHFELNETATWKPASLVKSAVLAVPPQARTGSSVCL